MPVTVSKSTGLDRYVPSIATDWDDVAPGVDWQELDASLCFVDISGFTNLSERLARKGRIGAEELTDVLNYVFGRMLGVAYLHGGSLLKFGGDALLLMFSGERHALRAASAAVEMRSVLREAEDYETSVGRLRLRMSVGIHSGSIDLFRVSGSHQELVVCGPGATRTTEMEKIAEAGEIVISEGTRAALPDGSAPTRKEAGWILKWRKGRSEVAEAVGRHRTDPDLVNRWVPVALRDYLQAAAPEPEHRIAAVAFIRFCQVDHLIETEGPEAVSRRISETISIIEALAEEEGVTFLATDINEDGGKVILVGGAPTTGEDDEGRLLRTLRRIADSSAPLEMHFGVNQGHVFAGEIGTDYRATYTIIGDTVNLAARLAAAAPPDTIYATAGVLDSAAILFGTNALEPFHVKGKGEAVQAYVVGAETGEREVETEGELPFVGRHSELSLLTEAIWSTGDGQGSVLTIVGDTGSGKSRLVREACVICSAVRSIPIRSESYGTSSPYRPLRDVFRSLLEIERSSNDSMADHLRRRIAELDADLLPYLPFIGDVTHIDVGSTDTVDAIDPRFRQDRLGDTVIRLLGHILDTATVFDLEDAQWMDDASAHLMGRIAAESAGRPWTVLVSRRGREGGFFPEDGSVLELGGLDQSEARTLVIGATSAAPLRPHEIDAIVNRSGGNPLFLKEILAVVRDTGSVEDLPDSLGSVVGSAIDTLPTLARRILRFCSVLGRSFRVEIVNEILAEDDLRLDAATRRSLRRFLITDGEGRLRFANAMVRDVAYDSLSFRRRRELHLRAARVTEEHTDDPDATAGLLALHYSVGGDAERAWHYGQIAGDQARDAYANVEAAAQYERALRAARSLRDLPDRDMADVWVRLGDVKEDAGLFQSSLDAYKRASRLVGTDPARKAQTLYKRARARERSGHYSLALRELTSAERLLDGSTTPESSFVRSRLLATRAQVYQAQEKPHEALRVATDAAVEAKASGNREALASAYVRIDWANLFLGRPDQAVHGEQALAIYEELGDLGAKAIVISNAGFAAYFGGRWDEAVRLYREGREAFLGAGNAVHAADAASNIAEVLVNQERFEEAEPLLLDAIRVLQASEFFDGVAFARIQLGRALLGMSRFDEAERVLQQALDQSRQLGVTVTDAATFLAECKLRRGDAVAALEILDEFAPSSGGEFVWQGAVVARVRAETLTALGRDDEALDILESGLTAAREHDLAYELGLLLLLKSQIGDPDPEAELEAASLLDGLGVGRHPVAV